MDEVETLYIVQRLDGGCWWPYMTCTLLENAQVCLAESAFAYPGRYRIKNINTGEIL